MNPVDLLKDVVPPRYRKLAYALLSLAAVAFSTYQAVGGDWSQFVAGLLTALIGGTATANTDAKKDADVPLRPKRRHQHLKDGHA